MAMTCNHDVTQPRAIFLADAHFHVERTSPEDDRLDHFCALLGRYAGTPHVVLLGDIFDFWFDYPHFYMKGYGPLFRALDLVRDAGSRLHFVGGNHDIWAAEFLHRRYGTDPAAGPLTLELDGQRVHCLHGDGLLGRDIFYQTFRAIVRHPLGVLLGKSLHPELLFAFSSWLSKSSRHSTRDEAEGIERKARTWLSRQRSAPWEHLVMGHVHHRYSLAEQGRRLSCLGGWFDELHYAIWQDGRLQQLVWNRDEGGSPR